MTERGIPAYTFSLNFQTLIFGLVSFVANHGLSTSLMKKARDGRHVNFYPAKHDETRLGMFEARVGILLSTVQVRRNHLMEMKMRRIKVPGGGATDMHSSHIQVRIPSCEQCSI